MRNPNRRTNRVNELREKYANRSKRVLLTLTLLILPASSTLVLSQSSGDATPRMRYVTTVNQLGPVAYRIPLGAISPDGQWLAYTAGATLSLQHIAGGPVTTLGRVT